MRALIVDDHALFREGFSLLLQTLAPEIQMSQAARVSDAVRLLGMEAYNLVFLDWWLHEQPQGHDALLALMQAAPHARVIVLSGERNQKVVDGAIETGASGFIPKEVNKDELTRALRLILRGGIYLPSAAPVGLGAVPVGEPATRTVHDAFPQLTPRQADVLKVVLRGQSNKEIARALGISATTVATHLAAIYSSIGVKNRTEAVFLASRHGALI